jgi:glutamate 5-kinase
MVTKLKAARICAQAGCRMVIARGTDLHPLNRLAETGHGTWFTTRATPASARKRWIAGSLKPTGVLTIDDGAARALNAGKSLLPAGVIAVDGDFDRGDAVSVRNRSGHELARGLTAYSAADAKCIIGRRSSEIAEILGYHGREEMIHRDELALL